MNGALRASLCALLLLWAGTGLAVEPPQQQITDLDQLLQSVRDTRQQLRQRNARREAEFLQRKDWQQAMLAEARRELEQRRQQNQPLLAVTQRKAREIERLQGELDAVLRDMGDLHSTFREFAGDFAAVLQGSMVSGQLPGRREQMRRLADQEGPPAIEQIESLWLLLQEEMTEAGKVARFEAPVVRVDGRASTRPVWRVGTFSLFSEGEFLRYLPETGEMLVLSRQPDGVGVPAAMVGRGQVGPLQDVVIDPTRGSLLGMLGYSPDLRERVQQGGVIGLIILVLGALGLVLAAWRAVYLILVRSRVRRQLADPLQPREGNPLGRVLLAVRDTDLEEEELLQLQLDEAVLAEIPALERGNGLIKLLAATSPLLGLLGTVTGMILTFQAISLYGTGDPKLMAGGISQALVTTVLGLVVAIPLLFCHSVIAYLSRSVVQRLDEQCAGVLVRSAEEREAS